MIEILVYGLIVVFFMSMIFSKILFQRFFSYSLKEKSIDPKYERRTQWQIIASIGVCGLIGSLLGLFILMENPSVSPSIFELVLLVISITVCFSLFGWIGFWIIDSLLRARIRIEIQKEEKNEGAN